jgi:hypothetical protein
MRSDIWEAQAEEVVTRKVVEQTEKTRGKDLVTEMVIHELRKEIEKSSVQERTALSRRHRRAHLRALPRSGHEA